jgi:hypothetical protein
VTAIGKRATLVMRDTPLSTAHNPQKVISILPFIRKTGTAFDDYATAVMGEAFDSARKDLHDSGQPEIVYEVIARRIIDEAKKGERDPLRLRNAALAGLRFGRDDEQAS